MGVGRVGWLIGVMCSRGIYRQKEGEGRVKGMVCC